MRAHTPATKQHSATAACHEAPPPPPPPPIPPPAAAAVCSAPCDAAVHDAHQAACLDGLPAAHTPALAGCHEQLQLVLHAALRLQQQTYRPFTFKQLSSLPARAQASPPAQYCASCPHRQKERPHGQLHAGDCCAALASARCMPCIVFGCALRSSVCCHMARLPACKCWQQVHPQQPRSMLLRLLR